MADSGTRNGSKRRVALLGAGYIADWHAKALASIGDIELVAVCDRMISRAESFAKKFDVPGVYGSLEAMLAAERLDSVHVLLPPDLHFQAAETILAAGVSAFIEKPMCLSPEHAARLTRLAAESGLRIGVGHNFLFSECYERLRSDLRKGILGSIDHLTITWHRELPQVTSGPFDLWMLREPGNVMLEIGPHCVAQMLDLVGVPETNDGAGKQSRRPAFRAEVLSTMARERVERTCRNRVEVFLRSRIQRIHDSSSRIACVCQR